jgi:curved DNA-binding protein CbpA
MMKNYYAVLDLPYTASCAEIEQSYRLLTRIYHPDRFREPEDRAYAEWKLRELETAYDALMAVAEPTPLIIHR